MSRSPDDGRDRIEPHRQPEHREDLRCGRREPRPTSWSPSAGLALPRSDERQPVVSSGRTYRLRGSETELLASVGTFRIVTESGLRTEATVASADLRSLASQGLVERRTIVINGQPEPVVVLTRAGRMLLDGHRATGADTRKQEYYDGFVKPREQAHDAQLFRLFTAERSLVEGEGGRITRVVLDYELKREYQTFVHRSDTSGTRSPQLDTRRVFAEQNDLPFSSSRIQFPDVRIEYESADGRVCHRDLELATEHYSRTQLAGKQRGGFRVYRAVGAGGNRGRGTPGDPHHLQWLR